MSTIRLAGIPKGKQRPRFFIRKKKDGSNYFGSFTPKDTVLYENAVRAAYQEQCGEPPRTGAVRLFITAMFAPPTSISEKKKKALLAGWYDKKPDIDNIAKAVIDGLNGVAFVDDKQISDLEVKKLYGLQPGIIIQIYDADEGCRES